MKKEDYLIERLQVQALIKYLDINKYLYLRFKISKKEIDDNFQEKFVSFYDMQKESSDFKQKFFAKLLEIINDKNNPVITSVGINDDILKEYKKILLYLKDKNDAKKDRLNKSFVSKMLATINPTLPVLDNNVFTSLENILQKDSMIKEHIVIMNDNSKEIKQRIDATLKVYEKVYEIEKEVCNEYAKELEQLKEILNNKDIAKKILTSKDNIKNIIKDDSKEQKEYIEFINNYEFSTNQTKDIKLIDFLLWKKVLKPEEVISNV